MKGHRLFQFLKPDWRKLLLFALFVLVALGGRIQAWAFSDQPPKPALYDLLKPLPIWPLWMLLLMPLALVSWPLRLAGIDIMGGPAWLFMASNLVYFYALACLLIGGLDWLQAARKR
jgi:hypothetical protein